MTLKIHLIRHGETQWSLSGQHTGRTDIPLTKHGEQMAREVGSHLQAIAFALVLTSPLQRARQTCELVVPDSPSRTADTGFPSAEPAPLAGDPLAEQPANTANIAATPTADHRRNRPRPCIAGA